MKDPDLKEAKAWFYTEYGRTPWYKRPYHRIKEWLANWACGCDTIRGDDAVLLMWRLNNPKPERVKARQESLERAKKYYDECNPYD